MSYRKKIYTNVGKDGQFQGNAIVVNHPYSNVYNPYVPTITNANFSSFLPQVYMGHPHRRQRYNQYDLMDQDPEINASLDTIAEFCTQNFEANNTPFKIRPRVTLLTNELNVLTSQLQRWTNLNKFNKRIFNIFRNVIKYGDQFFVKDPSTGKWLWIDHAKVTRIVVDQSVVKKPIYYFVEGLDPNLQTLVATKPPEEISTIGGLTLPGSTAIPNPASFTSPTSMAGSGASREVCISAEYIVHISLSDGMDNNWPFGNSILEPIFKTFKQKELLEDAIIIYRVQRAPERRVFYIDVGDMPPDKAKQYIERIKNEIHQRRIPNINGGGTSLMDATYNPLSILEDYFLAQTAEGRGNKVETLPGGENLGQIDDLLYFDKKLKRGLRIPPAYLPGSNEEPSIFNDGKIGTAFIQEFRFNKFCQRLQDAIIEKFDEEFKKYLIAKEIDIDMDSFEIVFNEPQSFSKYRQIELDSQFANIFTTLNGVPYLSKRFLLERYLGLTPEEIAKNEELLKEENNMVDDDEIDNENIDLGLNTNEESNIEELLSSYNNIEDENENNE